MNPQTRKDVILLPNTPSILGWASIAGKKEGQGPMGFCFDVIEPDSHFGKETWEQAESCMVQTAYTMAMKKAGLSRHHIDLCMGGDLLNQCIATSFGMRQLGAPFAHAHLANFIYHDEMTIKNSNQYKVSYNYEYVDNTENFRPKNKQELLNIILLAVMAQLFTHILRKNITIL